VAAQAVVTTAEIDADVAALAAIRADLTLSNVVAATALTNLDVTSTAAELNILDGAIKYTGVIDFGSVADNAVTSSSISAAGVAFGDFIIPACSIDLADLVLSASVTSADNIVFTLVNNSGGAVDLASATFSALVIKA
jgi:protein-disulfide isomerase